MPSIGQTLVLLIGALGLLVGGPAVLIVGCAGAQGRPSLPPPEFERPVMTPWDSGAAPVGIDQDWSSSGSDESASDAGS